jgi:hypothetical protein
MLLLALLPTACESMEPAPSPFDPAHVEQATVSTVAPAADGDLAFPTAPALEISSEQMAANAAPVDATGLSAPLVAADVAAPPVAGLPSPVQWPVRLLSTLPTAQPPRAILGLPSGEERVVSPGSILADQGLVVMMVTAGHVQLAKVEPAGDHATIETIEIAAQYP